MFKSSNQKEMAKVNEPNTPDKLNRIVSGTDIEGVIVSDSNIRIDGSVKGSIKVKGKLVVGATGKIEGDVVCENAEIEGNIIGKITVNGTLSLKASAKLECDIKTEKIAIEPGAVFSGTCVMGDTAKREQKTDHQLRSENAPSQSSNAGKETIRS